MVGGSADWLLLKTKPSRERYAKENIERYFGRETYLPLFDDYGKVRVLFPSYLFVSGTQWWELRGAWGISNVVKIGEEPAMISCKVIQSLRDRQERDGIIRLPDPGPKFRMNQALQITEGPFSDYVGLYQGMESHNRVKVLLDLLGRKVSVSVLEEDVRALV